MFRFCVPEIPNTSGLPARIQAVGVGVRGGEAGQGEGLRWVTIACFSQPSLPAWPESKDRLKGLPGPLLSTVEDTGPRSIACRRCTLDPQLLRFIVSKV